MHQITRDHGGSLVPRSPSKRIRHCVQASTFAHVGGFAAHQEVLARRCEEIDHLSVFVKPCLVFRTSRNEHDVTGTANSLFAAEAKLHLALEHPRDLFICVTVRLNMDAGPYVARSRASSPISFFSIWGRRDAQACLSVPGDPTAN